MAGTAEDPALAGFESGSSPARTSRCPSGGRPCCGTPRSRSSRPREIAPILGLTANGVAALAYRAREGLRQAYLQQHLQDPLDEGCHGRPQARLLRPRRARQARDGAGRGAPRGLRDCRALVLELGDVNHGMRAVIAPLVLGVGRARARSAWRCRSAAGSRPESRPPVRPARRGAAGAGAGGAAAGGGTAERVPAAADRDGHRASAPVPRAVRRRRGGGGARSWRRSRWGSPPSVVGGVALAAVAAVAIVNLLGSPDDAVAAAGADRPAKSPSASPVTVVERGGRGPTRAAHGHPDARAQRPAGRRLVLDGRGRSGRVRRRRRDGRRTRRRRTTSPPPRRADGSRCVPDPTARRRPRPPRSRSTCRPAGSTLEAGLAGQELVVGLLNSGGTAATDLVAEVTLPDGVTLDGIAAAAIDGLRGTVRRSWARPAGSASSRDRCHRAPGARSTVCRPCRRRRWCCASRSTSRSTGPTARSACASRAPASTTSPRRSGSRSRRRRPASRCAACPPASRWSTDGPASSTSLSANMGGTRAAAGHRVVSVHLPTGVTGAPAPGSAWTLHGRDPAARAARAPSPPGPDAPALAAAVGGADRWSRPAGLLAVELAPGGRNASETVTRAVHRPAPRRAVDLRARRPRPSPSARPRPSRCASRTRATCRPGRHGHAQPARGRRVRVAGRRAGGLDLLRRLDDGRVHQRGRSTPGAHARPAGHASRPSPARSVPSAR